MAPLPMAVISLIAQSSAEAVPLSFSIGVNTVVRYDGRDWLWFHPRVCPIPAEQGGAPRVLMTLQRHLIASDHYSGLYTMVSDDGGITWQGPKEIPELGWVHDPSGANIAVCDVTPGWHAPTGTVLAIGAEVRYDAQGNQLDDVPRAHQTAYAIYDPAADSWTPWRRLEMPGDRRFDFARSACAQWLTLDDRTVLLPLYIGPSSSEPFTVTVARYSFDGQGLTYLEHGAELSATVDIVRGLCEPCSRDEHVGSSGR